MRSIIVAVVGLLILAAGFCTEPATAQPDGKFTVTPGEAWSCVFGGQDLTLHFRVAGNKARDAAIEGRVLWHYAANQRTLARGEIEVRRNDAGAAEVILQIPVVRDGVIFRTDLTVGFIPRGEDAEADTLTKTLWLFPEDPFADQRETLKERKLSLFDPEGRTAKLFEKIELPHRLIRNAAVLEDRDEHSYVIVGEGTSLTRNRGLAERLLRFAAAGGTVLMLAPSEGVIPLPGEALAKDEDNAARPGELRFRQHHVIHEFDKRLDSRFLPGTGDFAGSKVTLRTRLSRIGMEVSEDGDWPWFSVEYPDTKGRFVFCGFSLIKHWNNGPTPRFLLNRILTPQSE
jgi:hypothetical protein